MFKKFQKIKQGVENVAKQASDLFAHGTNSVANSLGWVPSVEEFEQAWVKCEHEYRRVLQMYRTNPELQMTVLENSSLKSHLRDLATILLAEDLSSKREFLIEIEASGLVDTRMIPSAPLKPCLASMLENHIWEKLCKFPIGNDVPGMKPLVLRTTRYILRHIRHPLLPYRTAHEPLSQLIRTCALAKDEPTQTTLVDLLHIVWTKLGEDPSQITFFVEPYNEHHRKDDMPFFQQEVLSQLQEEKSEKNVSNYVETGFPFLIVDSLLPFVHWENSVGDRAREAVLVIASIGNKYLSLYLAHSTNLCRVVSRTIASDFVDLPMSHMDGLQGDALLVNNNQKEAIFRVIRFCNALAMAGISVAESVRPSSGALGMNPRQNGSLGDWGNSSRAAADHFTAHLLGCVSEVFLEPVLGPLLLGPDHRETVQWTYHLCAIIEGVASLDMQVESPFLGLITRFLIGGHGTDNPGSWSQSHLIRDTLINRITQSEDECPSALCAATLSLFSVMLDLDDPRVLDTLVLSHLPPASILVPVETPSRGKLEEDKTSSRTDLSECNTFLAKFPGVSAGKEETDGHMSLQSYYTDAERNVTKRFTTYQSRHRKLHVRMSTEYAEGLTPLGPFMMGIMEKLRSVLQNEMRVNLALTGILAILAQSPFSILLCVCYGEPLSGVQYEDALIQKPNPSSIFSLNQKGGDHFLLKPEFKPFTLVFEEVWKEALQTLSESGMQDKFRAVREVLRAKGPTVSLVGDFQDVSESELSKLKAIIVFEEFLKEMACIRQAKVNLEPILEKFGEIATTDEVAIGSDDSCIQPIELTPQEQ